MKYLLDANIIIALALNDNENLVCRAAECDAGDLVTSAIAYAEVVQGTYRDLPPAAEELSTFVEEVRVLDFDADAARAYGNLPFKRASYDRLIAAHALSKGLVVVTDNEDDFQGVEGLQVENWTKPL